MNRAPLLTFNLIFTILILLAAFWLRVYDLHDYPPGISYDEGLNTVDAFNLSRGAYYPIFEDGGEPEPLYKVILAFATTFFGPTVFSFRLVSAFFGVLTVATAFRVGMLLPGTGMPWIRVLAGLFAAGALTVSLGHITLSRGLYRAIPQPLFMLLFIMAVDRAFRSMRWRDFALSGFFLAGTIQFYTSGLILPAVVVPIGLAIMLFHRGEYQRYMLRLGVLILVTGIFTSPFIIQLLIDPTHILTRSDEVVSRTFTISSAIEETLHHLFVSGDPNPQYNTATQPLIAVYFAPFFLVGLLVAVRYVRRIAVSSALVFLILSAIPPIISNEPVHGLRIIGMYGAFPVFAGLGAAFVIDWAFRILKTSPLMFYVVTLAICAIAVIHAFVIYQDFWENPSTWTVYGRDLPAGEWFFRSDLSDAVRWMTDQDQPILLPAHYLDTTTTRTHVQAEFPEYLVAADQNVRFPDDVLLFVPISLETDDISLNTHEFVLLENDQVIVLPPISETTRQVLIEQIQTGNPVTRQDVIDQVGWSVSLPSGFTPEFYDGRASRERPLAVFDDRLLIENWMGPAEIALDESTTFPYFIQWRADSQLRHHYDAFLQIQTQDYQALSSDHRLLWRWLHPTTFWQTDEYIWTEFDLEVPPNLAPGAYRLVSGVNYNWGPVSARGIYNDTVENMATIAWLKVPQTNATEIPETTKPINAVLDDVIELIAVEVNAIDDHLIVTLYWTALENRPEFDATIFLHVSDDQNPVIAQRDGRPWDGQYPTFIWSEGEIVRTDYTIPLSELTNDDVALYAGMYTFPDLTRLTVMQEGVVNEDGRISLGKVADYVP